MVASHKDHVAVGTLQLRQHAAVHLVVVLATMEPESAVTSHDDHRVFHPAQFRHAVHQFVELAVYVSANHQPLGIGKIIAHL